MLILAIILFSLAALLGLYLLSYVLLNKDTPKLIAFTHGPLAITGLVLVIVYAFRHHSTPWISITLFVLAAMGGVMMIYKDISGKPVSKWVAIGHGVTATIALLFLIAFTFS